jgi:chromosome partitioning protein
MKVYFATSRNESMKVKVLTIACQKGGTAKTTTGLNLAVEAVTRGLKVAYIDLDPQVSACNWGDIRGEDRPPVIEASPVPHLDRALKRADDNGADLAIIDTAGRTNDAASAAVQVANLVLVPLQPSLIDLKTLDATLEIIRLAGSKPTRILLTRVRAAGSRHGDTSSWLKQEKGVEVCPFLLGERVIYQDAYARGLGVTEAEPEGKAAEEIRQVYLYISRLLELPTKKRMSHEEGGSARQRIA